MYRCVACTHCPGVVVRLGDGDGYNQDHGKLDLPLYLDAALYHASGT
ncbi:MAG: hypothetical protein IPO19_09060 [Rhodoferax sp.]|nr:hypothetical protein [Rhodoferax sp.]